MRSDRALTASGAKALELMDRARLRSVEGRPEIPAFVSELPREAAAILAEYQARTGDELVRSESAFRDAAPRLPSRPPPQFTRDATAQGHLWAARKGLTATIGAMRPPGTSMIFEDVAFPLPHLAAGVTDLQALLVTHGYPDGIVFGHAKDGNIHFLISQSFNDAASIAQYERFTEDLVTMVVDRYDGALAAEHSTGRNMAPFVEREWGREAYAIMRELKRLIDPRGILNPGVLLNDDPRAHLTNLKSLPRVEETVDRVHQIMVSANRSAPAAISRSRRASVIVIRRSRPGGGPTATWRGWPRSTTGFDYAMSDTCATDGMCATACPVGIDTGALIKTLRAERHGALANAAARLAASAFGGVERIARAALLFRRAPASRHREASGAADAVYFPSCVTRALADAPLAADDRRRRRTRAGLTLRDPGRRPWNVLRTAVSRPRGSTKPTRSQPTGRSLPAWRWSDAGRLPILVDTSPCAFAFATCGGASPARIASAGKKMRIQDSIQWAHDVLLPCFRSVAASRGRRCTRVCSVVKSGLMPQLLATRPRVRGRGRAADRIRLLRVCGRSRVHHAGADGRRDEARHRSSPLSGPCNSYVSSEPHVRDRHDARDRE